MHIRNTSALTDGPLPGRPALRAPRWLLVGWLALAMGACGEGSGPAEDTAGEADVGSQDTASPDAQGQDAQGTDATGTDTAGKTDAAADDAGTPDAGTPDAGTPDAGTADAGTPDAGTPDANVDSSPADTGPSPCATSADCPQPAGACDANLCVAGVCTPKALPDGAPCSDGKPCTAKAACAGGVCTAKAEVDCSDGNPCTDDSCVADTGACAHVAGGAGQACDDGNPCTSGTVCDAKGGCGGGANSCGCSSIKDCAAFDDGDPCNGTLYCNLALTTPTCEVLPSSVIVCDGSGDGPCEQTACNPATGACETQPVGDGKSCDDGNPCTKGEHCTKGACQAAANVCQCQISADCAVHEDGDPCTGTLMCDLSSLPFSCKVNPVTVPTCKPSADPCQVNTCDSTTGGCKLSPVADGTPCDDGDSKTVGDVCAKGVCGGVSVAQCKGDVDCAKHEDGDFCNGTLFCNQKTGKCQLNPATVVACPTGKDTACATNQCAPATGLCAMTPAKDGSACDDGDSCTAGEVCKGGSCTPSAYVCQCKSDGDCKAKEDGDLCNGTLFCNQQTGGCEVNPSTVVSCPSAADGACVTKQCQPKTGACVDTKVKDGQACDDGNPCTTGEVCSGGACEGTVTCGCTNDSDCASQDDGDLCNGTLYCNKALGKCLPNPATVKVCPSVDDTACAKNTCQPATGACKMVPAFNGASCDADGSPCTANDYCDGGACKPGKSVCGCYTDADCTGKQGGDKCILDMFCDKKSYTCKPTKVVTCDTSGDTPCSKTACDPATGKCAAKVAPEGTICGESAVCAGAQLCAKGKCVAGKASDCDDADACTTDTCDPKSGCQHAPLDAGPCDDGNTCTSKDHCAKGSCVGTAKDCSDASPCTDDACDPVKGCVYLPSGATSCDDGDLCSEGDFCLQGLCLPGSKVLQCDDGNPCTKDACDAKSGCVATAVSEGKCDDGDGCTKKDACVGGVCKGVQLSCDDGSGCTKDSCDPDEGCVHLALTATPCDDGNACTVGDKCISSGLCASGKAKVCDDGNPCTSDLCDPVQGCVVQATAKAKCDDGSACTVNDKCTGAKCVGSPRDCDDGLVCSKDSCDADAGCLHSVKVGSKCDDGNACTAGDSCTKSGACAPGQGLDCNDGNGCTTDACDAVIGCTHKTLDGIGCDDGDSCTAADKCVKGSCKGVGKSCDDGLSCTKDGCDKAGGCVNLPLAGTPCTDNNACTSGDTCLDSGFCKPGAQVDCDDNNPCTTDSCLAKKGCIHSVKSGAACDDGNACTSEDACTGKAQCVGSPLSCDDGKPCTTDTCDKLAGCKHKSNTGKSCDDGDACTLSDSCLANGICAPGAKRVCVDGVACTADSCDSAKGCVYVATPGKGCDDGSACTAQDACKGTTCVGSPVSCDDGKTCTKDSCDKDKGCVHVALTGSACNDDNACSVDDRCSASGACAPGNPRVCNDGKPCTADGCDPKTGCTTSHTDGVACDDGDACTSKDTCSKGACQGVTAGCDDGNPCTKDACNKSSGCTHTANLGLGCNDGDACTQGDACNKLGVCAAVTGVNCDDGKPCTADTCNAKDGCVHTPVSGTGCDDGDACTGADKCDKGACKGSAIDCDDGKTCTNDTCVKATGCTYTAKTGVLCSDGDACTSGDVCTKAGVCAPTGAVNCADTNPCTLDACNKSSGCTHTPQSGTSCTDGDACTKSDACDKGACKGAPVSCDDGEACTADSCVKASGCQHAPRTGVLCNDGDACTEGDACTSTGVCAPTSAKGCDDGKPCTLDGCNKSTGCTHLNQSGIKCDDGDACTTDDACASGVCTSKTLNCDDGNSCTTETCAKATGCVVTQLDNSACNDNNACTAGEKCAKGTCKAASGVNCDDNNPCTKDSCNVASGCQHAALNGTECNDNDQCTVADSCKTGVCLGTARSCDDDNACTTDSCDKAKGCLQTPKTGSSCDDGDACTNTDTCTSKGSCVGKAIKCDDGNACTLDTCDKATGCATLNLQGTACDDGNVCTVKDSCSGGSCAGIATVCDDGNPCTTDSCVTKATKGSPKPGECQYVPQTGQSCDDGNACTSNDACTKSGKCTGPTTNCSDGNACTTDNCNKFVGCFYKNAAVNAPCTDGDGCTVEWCDGTGTCQTKQRLWALQLPTSYKPYDLLPEGTADLVVVGESATKSTGGFIVQVPNQGKAKQVVPVVKVHRLRRVAARTGGGYISVGDTAPPRDKAKTSQEGTAWIVRHNANGNVVASGSVAGSSTKPNHWQELVVKGSYAMMASVRKHQKYGQNKFFFTHAHINDANPDYHKSWSPSGVDAFSDLVLHGLHPLTADRMYALVTATTVTGVKTYGVTVSKTGYLTAKLLWRAVPWDSNGAEYKHFRLLPRDPSGGFEVWLGKQGLKRLRHDATGKHFGVHTAVDFTNFGLPDLTTVRGDQLLVVDDNGEYAAFNRAQKAKHTQRTLAEQPVAMVAHGDRNLSLLFAPAPPPAAQVWRVERRDPWGNALCTGCLTNHGASGCGAHSGYPDQCNLTSGNCTGGSSSSFCDDGNPCTTDTVHSSNGCQHTSKTGQSCSLASSLGWLSSSGSCTSQNHCNATVTSRTCSSSNSCAPNYVNDYATNLLSACTVREQMVGKSCASGKTCVKTSGAPSCSYDSGVKYFSVGSQGVTMGALGKRTVLKEFGTLNKTLRWMRLGVTISLASYEFRLILKVDNTEYELLRSDIPCSWQYYNICLPYSPTSTATLTYTWPYPNRPVIYSESFGGQIPFWLDDKINTKVWGTSSYKPSQLILEQIEPACGTFLCHLKKVNVSGWIRVDDY